jgi:prevent-host-death family protein
MQSLAPIYPISDLRRHTKKILNDLDDSPVVLTMRGRPRAVLVDYADYDALVKRQQALEMTRDAFLLQQAQAAATGYRPFADLLQQHQEMFDETLDLPPSEA